MILRRYGNAYHSVDPAFKPAALAEIGFRRNRAFSVAVAEFDESHAQVAVRDLEAKAEGGVQREVEAELLAHLEQALLDEAGQLADGRALVILNNRDAWPKTRERREAPTDGDDDRIQFHWWVAPPLRVGVYGRRGG